ncbi:histidinol-phosphate transaminase [Polynucleobacter sp. Adler-ghost]|uniref:pyridoxal phosphate-dependent aminotransferase n=1 Tax=Polynucleobacter sp. Adler-ghost TaxID=2770234 RepID=UPI001BFDD070|nr:histidinol-phosphate transaminase [Polynucleobacter sp. Adler-ghost]QWE31055.1 histidinol-phosphate aminotransferase family protein [Polynucleobacter sp. Adler-ghost]
MILRPKKSLKSELIIRPFAGLQEDRDLSKLWLDKNENLDPEMRKVSAKILLEFQGSESSNYPSLGALYKKMATWLRVSPSQIMLTQGSDGAIRSVFDVFIEPGDVVFHTRPTFAMYPIYCQIYGAKNYPIDYMPTLNGPSLTINNLLKRIESAKPKLVCIPNPDSPTGHYFSENEIKTILEKCITTNSLLLVDEAYFPFSKWSAVSLVNQSPNLIVVRTFAKAWASAGLRVGYCVTNAEICSYLHKNRPMYEIGEIAAHHTFRLLDFEKEMLVSVGRINEGGDFFSAEMGKLGFHVLRSQTNFIHINFESLKELMFKRLDLKVLYRKSFDHDSLKGFTRFTLAPVPIMRNVVDTIKDAYARK